ncbi:MAG: AAA family ATPase [Spirochaetes bacterium]|nr:AAA family ATPase [Spirochaetota bacterium]
MPLIDDNFAKTAQNAPADILKNWDKINPKLEKIGENFESISLLSVETIRQFDEKELKLNYDKIRSVYYNYSQCIIKADGSINPQEESRLKKIFEIIYREKVKKEQNEKIKEVKKEEAKKEKLVEKAEVKEITLDEVMKDIDKLIGMKKIKDQIKTLINLIKVQKAREERKLPVTRVSLHSVFYGPPGTGKTTIARLLGKVFKCLGILTQGQIIETDRAGLVAGYVGQTAIKTDELLNKALDGILFIDEAYALKPKESTNDFGQEAINIILKRMEDYRDRLIVITAGYPDEMKVFIESNPGLKSRFNRYFYFDHYTPKELFEIFKILCDNSQFKLENNAKNKLIRLFQLLYDNRDRTFGNGRLVRNLYERILEKQANRIAGITPLSEEILNTLNENDILNVDEI